MYLLCANSISVVQWMINHKAQLQERYYQTSSAGQRRTVHVFHYASITTQNVFLAITKQNGYSYCLEIGAIGTDAGRI